MRRVPAYRWVASVVSCRRRKGSSRGRTGARERDPECRAFSFGALDCDSPRDRRRSTFRSKVQRAVPWIAPLTASFVRKKRVNNSVWSAVEIPTPVSETSRTTELCRSRARSPRRSGSPRSRMPESRRARTKALRESAGESGHQRGSLTTKAFQRSRAKTCFSQRHELRSCTSPLRGPWPAPSGWVTLRGYSGPRRPHRLAA